MKMGVIFGTTGSGIEVANPLSENWNFRIHSTGGDLDKNFTHSDIQYDAGLKLTNIGALVDWHPGGSIFRVTGGNFFTKKTYTVSIVFRNKKKQSWFQFKFIHFSKIF